MSVNSPDTLTRIAELETALAAIHAELRNTRRRGAESVTARETWPAVTAAAEGDYGYPEAGDPNEDQLPVIMVDGIVEDGILDWRPRSPDPRIIALSRVGWVPVDTDVEVAWDGRRWRILWADAGLRGGCLTGPHPGRGEPFDIALGRWDPAEDKWVYDQGIVKAIDWRYGVPYPEQYATGLFERRKSDDHGWIWETVSLDCESPGECEGYYGEYY
jgi:hypothetical protein